MPSEAHANVIDCSRPNECGDGTCATICTTRTVNSSTAGVHASTNRPALRCRCQAHHAPAIHNDHSAASTSVAPTITTGVPGSGNAATSAQASSSTLPPANTRDSRGARRRSSSSSRARASAHAAVTSAAATLARMPKAAIELSGQYSKPRPDL